ncbi:hypothetical protein ASE07_26220 [Noviherbaspirillum sp. Root189]|nr:hypothetical protein ASE07_26220 [Noviherbaspirillum sp. Root189]
MGIATDALSAYIYLSWKKNSKSVVTITRWAMADAWHALQSAIRALRKEGDIRRRLAEAYKEVDKLRSKDLPSEVRADHEWLHLHLHPHAVESILTEIRITVAQLSEAQLSEAVNRMVALYNAVEQYQPPMASTSSKRAACTVSKGRDPDRAKQLDLWES